MKCKLCGKKGVRLSHWRLKHKDYMARRRAAGAARRKASGPHTKARRTRKGRKRSRSTSEASESLPDAPVGFVVETVTYRRA